MSEGRSFEKTDLLWALAVSWVPVVKDKQGDSMELKD
jgi:hypothetical protein